MYCPNCGNDCGDDRFCVKCGTELSREEKKTEAWTVGMPCPHCGGTQLDGRSCAFCGAQLVTDMPERKPKRSIYPPAPVGRWDFGSDRGFLEMGRDHVRICKRRPFLEIEDHTIPYFQIISVFFSPSTAFSEGVLVIRSELNQAVPIPKSYHAKLEDPFCAFVPKQSEWHFQNAFCYLQLCAEINRKKRENG